MKTLRALAVVALWPLLAVAAVAAESVELDHRLRPDLDVVTEQIDENVVTMRVVEDRGLVARTAANGARFPVTYHTVNRQRLRFTTGAPLPDGGFSATMSVLGRRAALRLASGEERAVPGQPELDQLVMRAVVDAQGRVQQPTVQIEGVKPELLDTVRGTMASLLEQASRIQPVRVELGKSVDQDVNMQLPLPGLAPLDLKITASNRLIAVQDGQARVEMVYVMTFGVPDGPVAIEASGTGGGTLVYDIAARVTRQMDTRTLMTVRARVPDGTLEFEMNSRQTQQTQDAGR
jgi:hypothetical protein